ncbi:multiheme c-type cytochrome [Pseudoalteromonas sp. APC 3355]|uniref:multiheme c-type cytochrome n=1 Tax=Pseudoalteromonas sp. APC 3355 TaxID=3035199 RepID=UPI0025B58718|nr:multiheme c-type cytochrome [Pseudoalteromonas sp. APC 3355]MDN3476821.1 multiheme c-type cytochrome [Pseudoalteromonas sp. APC 3355]
MIKILKIIVVVTLLMGSFFSIANEECSSCHSKEVSDWQQSHHANAMAKATTDKVLGDFNNVTVEHFSQKALFYTKGNEFLIDLTENNTKQTYKVSYVFGFTPLQQYLIEVEQGKYQVFPFAWDSRDAKEGGQRWYANYESEDVKPNDRLHWLQPLQNWNGMCADCHSDNLERNYDVEKDVFDTHFSNINVGCASCHADLSKDHKTNPLPKINKVKPTNMSGWKITGNNNIATWHGEERDNSFMETCYACHSLRSPLTDGFSSDKHFLDQFSPSFLEPNLYHADGQIKEEVYVFGSFKQSKMYEAGVNCLDCHDKHTMKIKSQTNGLCLQCHKSSEYDVPKHHRHKQASQGSQCVNCHMPTNRYMGVDDRRDHSFKIPRPDISIIYDTPNACTQCHDDKTNEWANTALESWHGKAAPLSNKEHAMLALRSANSVPLNIHLGLINDTSLSEIDRASAITYLASTGSVIDDAIISRWVNSPLPLIRLAIAKIGYMLPESERFKSYSKLLTDKFKAVRVAAAQNLSYQNNPSSELSEAIVELAQSNKVNSWRGEGHINQSMLALNKRDVTSAIRYLKKGIDVDPYFDPNYVNLSDIYFRQGNQEKMQALLDQGLAAIPNSAALNYANGMAKIRSNKKVEAIEYFKKSMELEPNNVQYAYLYYLALDNAGLTAKALNELKQNLKKYSNARQLMELANSFEGKLREIGP